MSLLNFAGGQGSNCFMYSDLSQWRPGNTCGLPRKGGYGEYFESLSTGSILMRWGERGDACYTYDTTYRAAELVFENAATVDKKESPAS